VDEAGGTLGLERIDGWSVREILGGGAEGEIEVVDEEEVEIHAAEPVAGDVAGGAGGTGDGITEEMQGLQVDGAQGVEEIDEEEDSEGLLRLREVGVTPGMWRHQTSGQII
jgi:TP53 regulating kinase-like protein